MQSDAAGRMAYSPDLGAESSFPERHLDDDKAPFSGIGPERYQPAVEIPSQAWPGQGRPFLHHNLIHSHNPLVDHSAISNHPFPQTTVPSQAEWTSFPEQQPPGNVFWQPAPPEVHGEDDSDSMQSPNDSPEEFCPPLPTLTSSKKPGRQSTHRVAKPTTVAAAPLPHHPTGRLDRPYIPDFDYNTDWLDPSDPVAAFFPPPPIHEPPVSTGGEIEITYRDSSSSSKVNSKRIAHKLSEKTRRNRLTIAIREIQKLLPSEDGGDEHSRSQSQKEPDFVVRPGVPSSKLDIVEMAVGFIKDLKERNKEMAKRLKEAERKVEECRCHGVGGESAATPTAMEDAPG